jgi:hypothetical protein
MTHNLPLTEPEIQLLHFALAQAALRIKEAMAKPSMKKHRDTFLEDLQKIADIQNKLDAAWEDTK